MAQFLIDLHVHSRASADAMDRAEELVWSARARGLDGIALTDHDTGAGYRRLCELGLADERGRAVDGFLVIPGVEASTIEGHVLVLGAAWEVGYGVSARGVIAEAHRRGALAVAAHPFDRHRSGVGRRALEELPFDGVEGWNSKTLHAASNEDAARAGRRRGLIITAGSDAHYASTVGRAATVVEACELSAAAVLDGLRAKRTSVVPGTHTAAEMAWYLARGWLTRPWAFELSKRAWANGRARRAGEGLAGAVCARGA